MNPLSVRFTVNQQVNKEELTEFKARLAKLLSVKPGAALGPLVAPSAPVPASSEITQPDR